jgi:hypothetical protein
MRFLISVTAETHVSRKPSAVTVACMTAGAVLMFADLVEPKQVGRLVATRASGGCTRPAGAVRSVTFVAAARELPVLRARLCGMTAGARGNSGSPGVRLVALHTLCVAARSAAGFLFMAALTGCLSCPVVRLVAVGALLMPDPRLVRLARMTRLTACQERGGFVRQPAMATRTIRMPAARGDTRNLRLVAAAAQSALPLR